MLEDTQRPGQDARACLRRAIAASELPCYVYSYPSKRAYRPVQPERTLAEVAVEGSPDSMSPKLLSCLKGLGINRVSMGLQTLDPEEQRRVGRPYAPEAVFGAVEAINAIGFENVNYDLIYGLEGQGRETW